MNFLVDRIVEFSRQNKKVMWIIGGVIIFSLIGFIMLIYSLQSQTLAGDATQENSTGLVGQLMNLLFTASVLIGGMVILYFIINRLRMEKSITGEQKMRIVERMHLNPRQVLYLVRIGERDLLIGACDQSIQLIADLSISGNGINQEVTTGFSSILKEKKGSSAFQQHPSPCDNTSDTQLTSR